MRLRFSRLSDFARCGVEGVSDMSGTYVVATEPHTRPLVRFAGVAKRFRREDDWFTAVTDINLDIELGSFTCVVGPSGSGKSTLLNMLAGMMEPTRGVVEYKGQVVRGPNLSVGYMTQRDTLLPWRTVEQNVELPLKLRGVGRDERKQRTRDLLETVGLTEFERAFPSQLSGGMQKRALLARTLIYRPEVLLGDEPFGALDAQLKLRLGAELLRMWSAEPQTVLFVTHDIREAIYLGDRVVVINGRPGHVVLDVPVPLERPRDIVKVQFEPRFHKLYDQIYQAISGARDESSE
jgi:NitT/TauT family transport system ATP-binding protein